jgi:hypothetical protein
MFYEAGIRGKSVAWENPFSMGGDARKNENYLFWLKADKIFFSKSSRSTGLGT